MNLINRIVVIFLLVAVTALAIVAAVIPDQIVLAIKQIFDPMEIGLLGRAVLVAVAIVVAIGSALLVRAELRREKPRGVELQTVEGASAQLAIDSIAERLKRTLEDLAQIHSASPKVVSRGKTVDIAVTLVADPEVDVSQKADEAVAVIREAVEKGMGVKISKGSPRVEIKYHHSSGSRLELRR